MSCNECSLESMSHSPNTKEIITIDARKQHTSIIHNDREKAEPNTLTNLIRQKRGSSFSLFQVITINGYLNHTMVLIKPLPTKTRLWPYAQLSPML